MQSEPSEGHPHIKIPKYTHLRNTMGLIDIAADVQLRAWAIVKKLLAWTNEITLLNPEDVRKLKPPKAGKGFRSRRFYLNRCLQHWRKSGYLHAGPFPYEPERCDMPSWIEAYRVHLAVWRLELYRSYLFGTRASKPVTLDVFWEYDISTDDLDDLYCVLEAHGFVNGVDGKNGAPQVMEPPPPNLFSKRSPWSGIIPHHCPYTQHCQPLRDEADSIRAGSEFLRKSQRRYLGTAFSWLL